MKLTILGCYAATPRSLTNPTSQVLTINNHMFLIDCGEGTQVQLRKNKVKFAKIEHIFISHLHGDHFYGLIGLISTFMLLGREKPLHVYGPKGIKEVILLQLKLSNAWTSYPLYFHELESEQSEVIFEDDSVTVETIPLIHRVYTNGFLFKEKPKDRKLVIEKAHEYQIDVTLFKSLKKGKDVVAETGEIIPNKWVTEEPEASKSYAFCSDTLYNEAIVPQIKNVTVLYHESTFLEQQKSLTDHTKHSTAKQAATIAKQANAEQLVLGHYSTRYKDISVFKEEALEVFPNVSLAEDGKSFDFD
ncbi:ribonuclease Z [Zunongwangia sp.]|uniref:ribonuclease Z n=1 Tax=Zunongwangia sp. TaxID=1965325 RepID=UPI003AA8511B